MRLLLAFLFFSSWSSFAQKQLSFTDKNYEPEIRTVRVYPLTNAINREMLAPIVPIEQQNLVLEFDDLRDGYESYFAKLIHCNFDWSVSSLSDLDYMREYNEVPVNDYEFSNSLYLPYVHYRLAIPSVKLPGNYLLVVYRNGDTKDVVITRRIMIYEFRTRMATDDQFAGVGTLRSSNQQLNFTINYQNLKALDVMQNFKVILRQNQRWDNARGNLKPSFIREVRTELEYRFFESDKQFNAGNEFRFVDFRSINSPGQNTASIDKKNKPFELFVIEDRSKEHEVYAQYADLNGQYVIANRDYQDAATTGTYLYVTFSLASPKPVSGDVYVVGAFNNFNREAENKMIYNASQGVYLARMLLKQGRYDYQYLVANSSLPSYHFEGSHFETENRYDVLVYFQSMQPRADLLVGYFEIPVNSR
jgi:hypothetical protein